MTIHDFSENLGRTPEDAATTLELILAQPTREPVSEAIKDLGTLIDLAGELRNLSATQEAIARGERLLEAASDDYDKGVIHYFLANAWEDVRVHQRQGPALYDWEQPEKARQIVHLRWAVRLTASIDAETVFGSTHRRCQILTNLGNLMNHAGRLPDAIACWNQALELEPLFAMAIANRARGYLDYARLAHDRAHHFHLLRAAARGFERALSPELASQMHRVPLAHFEALYADLRRRVPEKVLAALKPHAHAYPKRTSQRERDYRDWSLANCLFLNDLNEISPDDPLRARDVDVLPGLTTPLDAPIPSAFGLFNQLKQEYAAARYLYYEGICQGKMHFADRHVVLADTLDYTAYGIGVEHVKTSLRLSYSLFDKVAYFINDYFGLRIPEHAVSFRRVWYAGQDRRQGLNNELCRPANTPLKGLFWLSKDLYDQGAGFTEALEPHARKLADLRNHLEHKYVKVHVFALPDDDLGYWEDQLAHSLSAEELEQRAMLVLQMARSALMLLSRAVYIEESRRQADQPDKLSISVPVLSYRDEFKA